MQTAPVATTPPAGHGHHHHHAAPHDAAPHARPNRPPVLDVAGHRFPIVKPITVIGRGSEADLVLDDTGVSRRHAEVHHAGDVTRIIDLGSTNGTFVDGVKRTSATLHRGSVITIGRTKLTFGPAEDAG